MKADQKQIVSIFILFVLVFSQFAIPQLAYAASTIYVAPGGLTSGTCSNWGTACDLQYALGIAVFDDELWVMQGTYMPTTTTDRNASFVLVDGVKIYGGFAGTETQLAQRNPTGNVTTLSGDIGLGGDTSDNSYHVVQAYSVSASAVLNGFTITNGNSNGGAGHGGGIFIQDSSPMFANLVISNNTASANGGGVYVLSLDTQRANYSSPTFTQVVISSNTAARGGGLYTQNSSPVLLDVTFNGNTATSGAGGGMNNQVLDEITDEYSIPLLTNVTFSGNTANGGGGLFNNHSYPLLTNVTFSGNTANIRGGAILNEGANPVLRNVTITGNTAPAGLGGAIRNIQNAVSTPSNPQIYNSILWGNGTDEITSDGTGSTTIVDSVVQGGFAGTNIVTGNPNLGGLANDGGNTQTHAISVGSSALNAGGVNSACAGTDQRNVSRPQGSSCDMGAYEFELANSYTDTTVADFNLGTVGACVVDGGIGDGALRLNIPTSTSCVFESRIFDAGAPVDWTTLASTTTLPAGTSVSFNVRTGNTVNPDITWTSWQGGGTLTNPGSRYIQYRATLTTTDMGQTPVLEDVTINYTTGSISILNSPSGTLTTWNNSFNWTGVDGATWYLLEVYTSMGAKVLYKWYTSAQTNCAAGTGCSLTPATSDLNLGNGDYQWRVLDYGAYGYGIWPVFKSFTLDTACYTLTAAVAPFGSGSVSVPLQSCTGGYTAGSVVQLQAVSGTGYKFLSWSGDASGTSSPTSIVMDGNKSVTANMRGNTPLTPTGALSNWDYAFSWTGLSDATWYLIEVETLGGTQVFYKWYTSLQTGCSGGTACSVTPTGLSLTTGDYKWRVLDYGAYGYGVHSTYKNFTLSGVACYTLTTNMSPGGSGDVTVPAQTCEEGYTAGSVIQLTAVPNTGYLLENWSGDASGTGNPVSVTMNSNKSVTANFKATPVLLSPSGTLTSWDNTFSWTGLSDATWYLLEVYASEGTQVLYKWYTSPQTGCSGGTACSVIPPETAGLANGNYKWRILDYGAYGYGIWTQYMNFTLSQ